MTFTTLIDTESLAAHLETPNWVIVDCRFSLADTAKGRSDYRAAHIPGAVYAHLDEDLSGPPVTDHGRHPLPTPDAMNTLFRRLGIDTDSQVVVYDDNGGIAPRLWWMLRYMGHDAVAMLDGGWTAWQAEERPVVAGEEHNEPGRFTGAPRADRLVQIDEVPAVSMLIDSRAAERYRGDVEPLDPIAGHIPGAVNYPYAENLAENGRFRPPEQLRERFNRLLGTAPAEEATFYCGSGVSACANLLALAHAGLGEARLYVGSWSEWSRDPERPTATGSSS